LAVGALAQLAAILPRDPDRVLALLDQGGVVDHQHRLGAADKPVGLPGQGIFERRCGPGRGRQEMVQLLDVARSNSCRHGLDALALARQD